MFRVKVKMTDTLVKALKRKCDEITALNEESFSISTSIAKLNSEIDLLQKKQEKITKKIKTAEISANKIGESNSLLVHGNINNKKQCTLSYYELVDIIDDVQKNPETFETVMNEGVMFQGAIGCLRVCENCYGDINTKHCLCYACGTIECDFANNNEQSFGCDCEKGDTSVVNTIDTTLTQIRNESNENGN